VLTCFFFSRQRHYQIGHRNNEVKIKKYLRGEAVKFFSANLDSLRKLYVDQLEHLHSAETQITEALPKMIKAATDPQLKQALETHLQETKGHVSRLEQILNQAEGSADSKKSKGIAALITEGEEVIKDASDESVRDAGIISAAQRVEHYEMAAYGTVRNFANILGETSHAKLLDQTLGEEKHADSVLTQIADTANTRADKAA
jgi:ferritin-like metal-binding protein YciE